MPKAYLNSPLLSLDTHALDKYFGSSCTQDPSLEGAPNCDQTLEHEDDNSKQFSSAIPRMKVITVQPHSYVSDSHV